ncbi:uncharacterized protein A1O5_11491 [Cladophialophora psammophila CBS 110553]|uniref:Uncharacterized protein n=1 Tax=Cladophialophora psammophila CBS 110553 TaxID=1182543 RepID=W9W5S1_9EURO|nr:uncharacterized protein A1O5_11491 [Cladophialophora psammophila CBS 110553]EXJ63442.1 hypothetical protein A1O5_11491 [Cladophialophora psammophila CBS 110553]
MDGTKALPADIGDTQELRRRPGPKLARWICVAPGIIRQFVAMQCGKLVQDIYRDHNPAWIWNTKAARLVHVHILDPASCEAVTHVVPPPPPPDARGYIKAGGSFFVVEEQPENRVDGGDFDNVKSVSVMDKDQAVQPESSLDPTQATQCKCGIRFCDCV